MRYHEVPQKQSEQYLTNMGIYPLGARTQNPFYIPSRQMLVPGRPLKILFDHPVDVSN